MRIRGLPTTTFFPLGKADAPELAGSAIDRREIMATEDDAPTASSGKLTTIFDRSGSIATRLGAGAGCGGVVAAALVAAAGAGADGVLAFVTAGGGVLRGAGIGAGAGAVTGSASFGREITALFSDAGAIAGDSFSGSTGCSGGLGGSGKRSSAVRNRMLCIRIVPVSPSIVPVITTSFPKNTLALS